MFLPTITYIGKPPEKYRSQHKSTNTHFFAQGIPSPKTPIDSRHLAVGPKYRVPKKPNVENRPSYLWSPRGFLFDPQPSLFGNPWHLYLSHLASLQLPFQESPHYRYQGTSLTRDFNNVFFNFFFFFFRCFFFFEGLAHLT